MTQRKEDTPLSPSQALQHNHGSPAKQVDQLLLHRAMKSGQVQAVEPLLSQNVNAKDQFGSTPLHLGCFHGHIECVKILLAIGENVEIDSRDMFHRTPLFYAARNGHRDILNLLISKGADVNAKTDGGETPLIKASYYGHLKCIEALMSHKDAKINEGDAQYGNTPLHNVASRGFIDCLNYLLMLREVELDLQNANGFTALHLAVTYKQEEAVKILLNHGANMDTRNKNKKTPLEDANSLGFKDIAKLLKKAAISAKVGLLKEKELSRWTPSDVAEFIGLIGFPQYKDLFELQNISGKSLRSLTLSCLKNDLGITSYGHRATIIKAISKLHREFKERKLKEKQEKSHAGDDNSMKDDHPFLVDSSVWHINFADLKMNELLGKGFYGEVRRAVWKGADVAVKVIYRETFGSQSELNTFYKELQIICKLRHPNILMFLGACTQDGNRCIVTEYLVGGSLFQLIHHSWDSLEKNHYLRVRICTDIVKGMTYLHDLHILHRDLTPKNLLLDANLTCKIADFGLSRVIDDSGEMTASLGCLPYQAPEVFRGDRYSEPADIFSFSMVMYELFTGFEPHKDLQPLKYANLVAHEAFRPPLPGNLPERWEKCITSCWNGEPSMRPSFPQLLVSLTDAPVVSPTPTSVVATGANFDYIEGSYTN